MVTAQAASEYVVRCQSVRWHDVVGRGAVARAPLAVVLSVLGDRCGTATLLRTGATATGWDVDRAVDASVDGAAVVPYPVAHPLPLPVWCPRSPVLPSPMH